MHKSYLEFGFHVEDLLFKGLTIQSVGELKDKKAFIEWCISEGLISTWYECLDCSKNMKLVENKNGSIGHGALKKFVCHTHQILMQLNNKIGGMVGLCISVAIFTFVYESVKTMRQKLVSSLGKNIHVDPRRSPLHSDSQSETSMLVEMKESQWKRKRLQVHTVHALLYMIQVTMGYLLMLIIMSYNAWLAITVFAAAGFSYYFFSTFVLYRPSVVPIEILAPESCE